VAVIEPVHGAVGQREHRHLADEGGEQAIAVEIEGRDCGHGMIFRCLPQHFPGLRRRVKTRCGKQRETPDFPFGTTRLQSRGL
jgi:hypothetical protein